LYFPYVGLENHVGGRLFHKVGVYVNGAFSWIDDGNWNIEITSPDDNMTGVIIARNEKIGIELRLEDTIYNEKDIYIRKIDITNFFNEEREVKLYINQQFEIYESHRGDTAYFDPINNVIIHYKGRRVFVINALKADAFGIDDYSIGLFGIEGRGVGSGGGSAPSVGGIQTCAPGVRCNTPPGKFFFSKSFFGGTRIAAFALAAAIHCAYFSRSAPAFT
jgi:hypothetical protein